MVLYSQRRTTRRDDFSSSEYYCVTGPRSTAAILHPADSCGSADLEPLTVVLLLVSLLHESQTPLQFNSVCIGFSVACSQRLLIYTVTLARLIPEEFLGVEVRLNDLKALSFRIE